MANNQTYIKLEIDPADYEKVKQQFRDIYDIADKAALRVQVAAQQGVQLTALRRGLAVSIFINVILLAVVAFTIGGN